MLTTFLAVISKTVAAELYNIVFRESTWPRQADFNAKSCFDSDAAVLLLALFIQLNSKWLLPSAVHSVRAHINSCSVYTRPVRWVIRTGNNKVSYRKQIVRQQLSQKKLSRAGRGWPWKSFPSSSHAYRVGIYGRSPTNWGWLGPRLGIGITHDSKTRLTSNLTMPNLVALDQTVWA